MLGPKPDAPAGVRYTRGPWTVTGGGVLIYSRPAKQEVGYAREVYMCRAEREANARLMAAAPELLEAAKGALAAIKLQCAKCDRWGDGECFDSSCTVHEAVARIEATIEKAEGS